MLQGRAREMGLGSASLFTLAEARERLASGAFDVVITDMRLPDGLGLELLRELATTQRKERCIMITAYGSAENAVEALKCGAFDYLTKPVDLKQFRGVVASALQAPERAAAAMAEWEKAHPGPQATLAEVADHVEHIAKLAGHAHVGLGADLDGIADTPAGLEGVETYPALLAELMRRGWSDADIAALAGGNILRVMEKAEGVAASLNGTLPTTQTLTSAP